VTKVVTTSDPKAIQAAASALSDGELVVIPTDTVYGLAARVDKQAAIDRIFTVKQRGRDSPIPVLVQSVKQTETIGELDDRARRLAQSFWPGSLTIVVPRRPDFEADLGGDGRSVGLRIPNDDFCLRLLSETGPLAATSANPSGDSTPTVPDTIAETFGDRVALYVDGGLRGGNPSTVVSLINGPVILREGSVGWSEIRQVL
jgi:L-threonylcarbamoyladenylate synthase